MAKEIYIFDFDRTISTDHTFNARCIEKAGIVDQYGQGLQLTVRSN